MPEFPGRLRTPRLASAPSSPALGELYYNTASNRLFWWNGTAWVDTANEVSVGPSAPSPRVAETIWIDTDADPVTTYMAPAIVTSLPSSPVDGQEVYYLADAANGIAWHLRYRAAASGSYKWEFLGGSPMRAQVTSAAEYTSSTSYVDLGTVGPSVTAPLAGDYELAFGCHTFPNTIPGPGQGCVSLQAGGAASDTDGAFVGYAASATPNVGSTTARTIWKTLAAGNVVKHLYRVSTGTWGFQLRWLFVKPVRVG